MPFPTSTARPCRRGASVLLVLLCLLGPLAVPDAEAAAAPHRSFGWRTAADAPETVPRGRVAQIRIAVTSSVTRRGTVRLAIVKRGGQVVHRRIIGPHRFEAGRRRVYTVHWRVPRRAPLGQYRVQVAVARPHRRPRHVNANADRFRIVRASAGRFGTLPPGARLPGDEACAARVRPAREIRPANRDFNRTTGRRDRSLPGLYARVTGNFTGTTDEIIQWASCKWGLDEDVVRAQTAKESWWFHRTGGDWTTNPANCPPGHPIGADGRPGECPESVGLQQVRYPYHQWAFPHASFSSAHNMDYALAARRNCFEGNETWLNNVERGREYRAGDLWGCLGAWFSGRWYTPPAVQYIGEVRDLLDARIWTHRDFIGAS